jgi:hypothetical protein
MKSTSSVSASQLRSDSTSWAEASGTLKNKMLQEKGRWAISPDSCASHPLHSYAVGYYSQSKYNVPRDWLWEACHIASVPWGTHCKEFCSEEGPHYRMERSARNHLERNQVKSAWEVVQQLSSDKQQSTLLTSLEIPWGFQSWAVLRWLSGGLCNTRQCQFEDLDEKKRYDSQSSNGHLHKKPLERKAEWGENASTNPGTRFPQASYFEKTRTVCQKHGGACTV